MRTHDCDDEHDQIVDAIERHDEVAAETAMRQHINNAFIFKKANAEVQHKNLMKYNVNVPIGIMTQKAPPMAELFWLIN